MYLTFTVCITSMCLKCIKNKNVWRVPYVCTVRTCTCTNKTKVQCDTRSKTQNSRRAQSTRQQMIKMDIPVHGKRTHLQTQQPSIVLLVPLMVVP